MQIIDLRSDTVTRPSKAMKAAMMDAPLGDDVFNEDPTVQALQEMAADMFGMDAALFCPSGTMTNQIAVKVHTKPIDEIILHKDAHIYKYETGGWALHSGVSVKLLDGPLGQLSPEDVEANIQPDFDWLPRTRLVSVENTVNRGGGSIYTLENMKAIAEVCKSHGLRYHLDGARLFNAIAESDYGPKELGSTFDSISICMSKGLGAPIGSLLLGSNDFIKEARRVRKVFGGGMRQVGIIAAACKYALQNNTERVLEDHERARKLGAVLNDLPYIDEVLPTATNILIFKLNSTIKGHTFIEQIDRHGIKAIEFGPQWVRFVTHLDFTDEMLNKTINILQSIKSE